MSSVNDTNARIIICCQNQSIPCCDSDTMVIPSKKANKKTKPSEKASRREAASRTKEWHRKPILSSKGDMKNQDETDSELFQQANEPRNAHPVLRSTPGSCVETHAERESTRIIEVYKRRIDIVSLQENYSIYKSQRLWVQDDPYRYREKAEIDPELLLHALSSRNNNPESNQVKIIVSPPFVPPEPKMLLPELSERTRATESLRGDLVERCRKSRRRADSERKKQRDCIILEKLKARGINLD